MKITETYTGSDATLEILIMLLGAFILGWILRWLYDTYLFEYVDEVVEDKEQIIKIDKKETINDNKIVEEIIDTNKEDDLKLVEGIGPKIESLLKSSDIKTFKDLSEVTPEQVRSILREKGGERYAFHDPTTWPDQAKLADENRMDELKEYQDFLNGGRV